MTPDDTLIVFLRGRQAARVTRQDSSLRLAYSAEYAQCPTASPLSLSMPLHEHQVHDRRVEGWMSGLLPGNADVRKRWAAKYGAASPATFDLLGTRIGMDCPGAVQFCKPESTEEVTARLSGVRWLSDDELNDLVAGMVRESSRWVRPVGQSAFSLAGAQAKTALCRQDGDVPKWGEPWGQNPTTHILKPSMADFADQSINEHLCMTAARYCGLASARTEMATIAGHHVLVVHRFDRLADPDGAIRRVHQEDLHQACGDPDASIYQGDNGEGHSISHLSRLLREHSADPDADIRAFFDALALNWVLCNTDAHSKNYSVLFNSAETRLAPLYDVWSIMPHDPDHYRSYTLAMSALADRRVMAADTRQAWEAVAKALGIEPAEGAERAVRIAGAIPEALERAADELQPEFRSSPTVKALVSLGACRRDQCLDNW
ncbi:MAG: HipA domain-containing protein [Acidimicrobiaceae bacterium]|nr:HipA domain-containing protein [Acidimicrobiaceae bacterium]